MKIIGLDGKEYNWKPEAYHKEKENQSGLHKRAKLLIKKLFPFYSLHEEVLLVGVSVKLYLDIYINSLRLAFEIQGAQHYTYNSFFYSSAKDFRQAKARDKMKKEWCELNNIDLVELPYNETEIEWTARIKNR